MPMLENIDQESNPLLLDEADKDTTWTEVIKLVKFTQTYSLGRKSPFTPEEMVGLYSDSVNGNFTPSGLAHKYTVPVHVIPYALKAVSWASSAITSNGQADMSLTEKRIWDIYLALSTLPESVSEHIRKRTETGRLLTKNNGVVILLRYLSTGNPIEEYTEVGDIKNQGRWWIHPVRTSILSACLGEKPVGHNPYSLIRIHLLNNYLKNHTNIYNRSFSKKAHDTIYDILNYSHQEHGEIAHKLSYVRRFFEFCAVIDFYTKSGPSLDIESLKLYFPEINIDSREPLSMDLTEYYRTWLESGEIPNGLRIVIEISMLGKMDAVVELITSHIPYAKSYVLSTLMYGLYFFENLLNTCTDNSLSYKNLDRNPRQEVRAIFDQLFKERANPS